MSARLALATRSLREEIILPYPATLDVEPVATHCRGTLLMTSMAGIKRHGHYERYLRALPVEHQAVLFSAAAGMWVPIETGIAHYRACDSLDLPTEEMLELGGEVVRKLQATFLGTIVRSASAGVGITPLTGMTKFAEIYARSVKGGGARLVRLGPKDLRVDFVGCPLALLRYFRVAYRGFIQAGCEFFAQRVVVAELAPWLSPTTVAYRIAWV